LLAKCPLLLSKKERKSLLGVVDDILLEGDLCIFDCYKVLLSLSLNEFLCRKNNSIVMDALFDFILNSNKKTSTKK